MVKPTCQRDIFFFRDENFFYKVVSLQYSMFTKHVHNGVGVSYVYGSLPFTLKFTTRPPLCCLDNSCAQNVGVWLDCILPKDGV